MSTWIIVTIVMIWFGLPALLIVSACIHSSRLSRAEEAEQRLATRLPAYTGNAPAWAAHQDAALGSDPVRIPSLSEIA